MATVLNITAQDLNSQIRPVLGFGSVTQDEFGTILAQKSKTVASNLGVDVTTATSTISDALGTVGKYGITATGLESAGYLKPGTVDRYLGDPSQLSNVLSSSAVWTGKEGVNTLDNVLGNASLQTDMQSEIYTTAFSGLKSTGTITGLESSDVVGSLTSVAADFGVGNTTAWLDNNIADAAMGLDMDMAARSGMLSTDFVSSKAAGLLSGDLGGLTSGFSVDNLSSFTGAADLTSLASNSISSLASSIGGINIVQGAAGQILGGNALSLASSVLSGGAAQLLGNLAGAFGSLFSGFSGFSGGGPKVQAPKIVVPQQISQTINRAGIDAAMTALIGNAKVATPNFTGVLNASAFNLPSLSGLVNETKQYITTANVSYCSGAPELINPSQAECEAAGGTWISVA